MSMQPTEDQIVGGTVLRIPAIQSPNYVAGTSGWIIRQDGTVEFSTGTFRGSISVGPNPGAHFVINNPATGDMMDAYDASNHLIAKIDSTGQYTVYQYITGTLEQSTEFGQQGIIFSSAVDLSMAIFEFSSSAAGGTSTQASVILQVDNNAAPTHIYTLQAFAGSDDGSHAPTLVGSERGVSGSLLQGDTVSSGNLRHTGTITGTTDASGFLTFAHGALFTPTRMQLQVHDVGTPGFGMLDYISGTLSSLNATVFAKNFNGTTRTSASITFDYEVIA